MPTIVPVRPASPVEPATHVRLDLAGLSESQFRQGPDGWHAVLSLRGVEHRIWFKEAPIIATAYTVELPLDRDFEFRAAAGTRLWRGLNGRPQGAPPHRDFGISSAEGSTRLAGVGRIHRWRYLSRNRKSSVGRPTHCRTGLGNS